MAGLFKSARMQRFAFVVNFFVKARESLFRLKTVSNTGKISPAYSHEKSSEHLDCFHKWNELDTRLATQNTTDVQNQRKILCQTLHWQQVLECLVSIVRVMVMQNMAFRGSTDNLYEHNNGNFLNSHIHYLGKEIQNEIIGMLASQIQ